METVTLSLLLMAPVLWLVGVAEEVQRAGTAASSAARAAATAAVVADPQRRAHAVDVAVATAFADEGLDPARAQVTLHWEHDVVLGEVVNARVSYPLTVAAVPFTEVTGPEVLLNGSYVMLVRDAVP